MIEKQNKALKYDELYKGFISSFSDDKDTINAIAAENAVDDEDGMHIAFGMVVLPFLSRLVEENQTAKIEKAFAFFEDMASSDDHLISEVLEFTVIEGIIAARNDFSTKCKSYMKPRTYESYERISQNFSQA